MDDDRYMHIVKSQPALSGFNFYKYVNNDVVTTCHLRKKQLKTAWITQRDLISTHLNSRSEYSLPNDDVSYKNTQRKLRAVLSILSH